MKDKLSKIFGYQISDEQCQAIIKVVKDEEEIKSVFGYNAEYLIAVAKELVENNITPDILKNSIEMYLKGVRDTNEYNDKIIAKINEMRINNEGY